MQSMREWSDNANRPHRYLLVCSDKTTRDDASSAELPIPPTTNPAELSRELGKRSDRLTVIFSTYHSLPSVKRAMRGREFDLVFADEAHRTTGTTLRTSDPDGRGGDDHTYYTMIHDIPSKKHLYMTATERLYSDALKANAERAVISMDDERIYGKRFYELTFKEAVESRLLTDFRVKIQVLPEEFIGKEAQQKLAKDSELDMKEPTRLAAIWHAITKPDDGRGVLQRVIVFSNTIKKSQEFAGVDQSEEGVFSKVVDEYNKMKKTGFRTETRHIDGKSKALDRRRDIKWLSDSHQDPKTCRILSNARCLSEGVDVPALDGVVFLEPRKSKIDVVQSVGRVMRRAEGKDTGYVILPVVVPAGKAYHESLNDGKTFKVAWDVLRALRSHDESFAVEINRLILDDSEDTNKKRKGRVDVDVELPKGVKGMDGREIITAFFGQLKSALVREVGNANYYDSYGREIGAAAAKIESRIQDRVKSGGNAKKAITDFNTSLKRVVSNSINEKQTVQVVAQHIVLSRIFDGLFEGRFRSENPVAKEFEKIVRKMNMPDITRDLEEFYKDVDEEMNQITSRSGRQTFIKKIYGNFFATVDKKGAEKHGIVYTPIECIDFIINSVEYLLHRHFNKGFNIKGIKVLEPFAGTGTFITRLLESGLLKSNIEAKYLHDISANELILLAHYVATINIETTYKSLSKKAIYIPFPGMSYTDTLGMNPRHLERPDLSRRQKTMDKDLPELDKRIKDQMEKKIDVIIGNPPYSAKQKSFDDSNPNISYPDLDKRLAETYGRHLRGMAKAMLRDSYIRSIRWMSDRIANNGIIGIITNGSFMRSAVASGMRAHMAKEFDEIWCFDLLGNAGIKNNGRNIFEYSGQIGGSKTPITILFLVKNKKNYKNNATIKYYSIGPEYYSGEEKRNRVKELRSIENIINWIEIFPDRHNDWLDQRSEKFYEYFPMGKKNNKSDNEKAIFDEYSSGIKTHRDIWVYNSSKIELTKNMKIHIKYYNEMNVKKIKHDPTRGKWSSDMTEKRIRKGKQEFDDKKIRITSYRPFFNQKLYYDSIFNTAMAKIALLFPNKNTDNIVIVVPYNTGIKFSTLITDKIPNLTMLGAGYPLQCFPLYIYKNNTRIENILDSTLQEYQTHYKNNNITKKDIFYYIYGILHHPTYRSKFANNLMKELPHIPMAPNFKKFTMIGKKLADLHIGYESCKRYNLGKPKFIPKKFSKLSFGNITTTKNGKMKRLIDYSTIRIDGQVIFENIPKINYIINGRTPLAWIVDRYKLTMDKESGIINDPCTGTDIISVMERAVYVGLESERLIAQLPEEFEPKDWKPKRKGLDSYVDTKSYDSALD